MKSKETVKDIPGQHGFQKGKSTITAIPNDWTANSDQGNSTDVVFLDSCEAFDKVPHGKLLHKLDIVGINPRITEWIRAFLSEWEIPLSTEKTKFMHIGSNNSCHDYDIRETPDKFGR
ncbi:hypothetical protein Y032_0039g164 [Ancylostoma ceylanicum]|uniref:Reverse transcriptase domain-containing protein n=1 Tax=Ancylostoma ceylanicum TaxID=53326 RepID=A0A016UHF3_9BILA|nr:hypothetical protein Y032_0039g164 [Ancylostoma ceylanicum]